MINNSKNRDYIAEYLELQRKKAEQPEEQQGTKGEPLSGQRDYVAEYMKQKETPQEPKDLLTKIGITNPLLRFGAGVLMSAPETIKSAAKAGRALQEEYTAPPFKKILPATPNISEIGTGAAYTLGNIALPAAGAGALTVKLGLSALAKLSPKLHTEKILESLSKGMTSKQNAQFLLNKLKEAYNNQLSKYHALIDPVKERVGLINLPHIKNYSEIDPANYTYNLKDIHNKFLKNPTFENADNLYIELNKEIGRLRRTPSKDLSPASYDQMQAFAHAKDALGKDMGNLLEITDPKLAEQYLASKEFYRKHVIPYTFNPKLANLLTKEGRFAEKAKIEPKNIANIFKVPMTPETELVTAHDMDGANLMKTNIEKIVDDMGGKEIHPHILYSELTKGAPLKAEDLLKKANLDNLAKEGMDIYSSPEIDELLKTLSNKIKIKKTAAPIAKGAAGALGLTSLYKLYKHRPAINNYYNELPSEGIE